MMTRASPKTNGEERKKKLDFPTRGSELRRLARIKGERAFQKWQREKAENAIIDSIVKKYEREKKNRETRMEKNIREV